MAPDAKLLATDNNRSTASSSTSGRMASLFAVRSRLLTIMCMLAGVFVLMGVVQILLLRHVPPHLLSRTRALPEHAIDSSVRFWVDDYLKWHTHARQNEGARILVYNTVAAGLGDNIRGMMRTYAFAVLTKRVFLVNWTRPYPLATVIGDNAARTFLLRSSDVHAGERVQSFHYYRMRTADLYAALRSKHRIVAHGCGPRALIHEVLSTLRAPHWSNTPIPPFNDAARRAAARAMLEPSKHAAERHTELLERYKLCVSSSTRVCPNYDTLSTDARKVARQYIAVHARLGIGTGEYSTLRFRTMRGNEKKVARCFARRVRALSYEMGDAAGKIMLATDTPAFQTIFRNQMRNILPHAEVFTYNSKVTHYRGIPAHSSAGMRNFHALWTEMRLIGDAKHIISFHSGFSLCGFWIGRADSLITLPHHECGLESEF